MRILKLIIIIVLTISCTTTDKLDNWIGNYHYSEKPVEILADYNLVMIWTLNIKQEKDNYTALIEVNGQQTYMVIQAIVKGDNNKINLIFDKEIEGAGYGNFKKGDNLLELTRENGKIKTKWNKLTPILTEEFQNDTLYFELDKQPN
ncbi:MAG: DUF5991 domain-containing protein [Bacteroidota bacterium]